MDTTSVSKDVTAEPLLRWTTEVWDIFPVVVPRRYSDGDYQITRIHRQVMDDGEIVVGFFGYILTKKGIVNGTLQWRRIFDADSARLTALLPEVES